VPDESAFDVQLVTPERLLLGGQATEVILRTGEGDITFLAGHAPLVGSVEPGVLRVVRPDGDAVRVATHGGFVQVEGGVPIGEGEGEGAGSGRPGQTGTRVTLLIGVAELVEEIDVERARAALERAQEQVSELGGSAGGRDDERVPTADLLEAQAAVRRAEVRIEAVEAPSTVAG
jgi:F-type H+-transporting ATPase subunit epsilon